jgi:thermitase
MYPAAYDNVISVGATDQNDRLARWSNRGEWVTVSAPGVDIYSTSPDDKYVQKSGTSFATALVSGEAALLYAIVIDRNDNGYINDEVRYIIQNSTDAIINADAKGRINVLKAVNAGLTEPP